MCILRGFLEARSFVFNSTQRRHLYENGQDCRFTVEMTLRGTYGGIFYRRVVVGPTELGNPHQTRDFHIPTATTATAPVLAVKPTPLKSRALSDSCTEPFFITLVSKWGSAAPVHSRTETRPRG